MTQDVIFTAEAIFLVEALFPISQLEILRGLQTAS
jgi:hypothetical protein